MSIIKRKNELAPLFRKYAIGGLFLVAIRYENIPFFSMRAIFALFIVIGVLHLTYRKFVGKKNLGIEVIKKEEVLKVAPVNPYAPKKKKKSAKKNKKKHSKQWKKAKGK